MRSRWRTVLGMLGLYALASCAAAQADTPLHYDQVELSASAEREVAYDLLIATLYVEHEGQRQAEIASRVNDTIAWALATAKAVAGVKTQTTQYTTYPVYANDGTTQSGWRARQAIRLEAHDAQVLGELIGTLQERLAVESIGFGVSKESRDAAENALTVAALARFQARAQQVAATLGRPGYRLVRLSLSGDGEPPVPLVRSAGALAMAAKEPTPAQLEAGTQTLRVTAAGTIQLDAP